MENRQQQGTITDLISAIQVQTDVTIKATEQWVSANAKLDQLIILFSKREKIYFTIFIVLIIAILLLAGVRATDIIEASTSLIP